MKFARVWSIACISAVCGLIYAASHPSAPARAIAALPPPANLEEAALRAFAWNTFQGLVMKDDQTPLVIPLWETWTPKCRVSLDKPCGTNGNTLTPAAKPAIELALVSDLMLDMRPTASHFATKKMQAEDSAEAALNRAQPAFFRSIRTPVQSSGLTPTVPILASIMLNPSAVTTVEGLAERGGPSNTSPVAFSAGADDTGAIVTKAIWTMRKIDSEAGVCETIDEPFITKVRWSDEKKEEEYRGPKKMPAVLPNPLSIDLDGAAWSRAAITLPGRTCEGANRSNQFPTEWFHSYAVEAKGVPILPVTQQQGVVGEAAGRAAVQNICADANCIALMMGIHIMRKISPADGHFGADTKPRWVFMTFWWTPCDNHSGLPMPWNHYQFNVTTEPRVDNLDGTGNYIVFNPYLEGPLGLAGAETNCVTCHNLARFNPMMTSDDITTDGGHCGNLEIGKSAPHDCQPYAEYLSDPNSMKVDGVWSIASFIHPNGAKNAHARKSAAARLKTPKRKQD